MSDLNILQKEIQYQFQDPALLRMALTHPSVAHEQGRLVRHNQRLEFLGDAVLGLVLTRELYDKFPNVSEGPLTKARAQMINRRTLAEQARQIGLQNHLILSRGEEANLLRAQRALYHRARCNRAARRGTYDTAMETNGSESPSRSGASAKALVTTP